MEKKERSKMKLHVLAAALLMIILLAAPLSPGITAQDQGPRRQLKEPAVRYYYPETVSDLSGSRKLATPKVEIGDPIDYTVEILNTGEVLTTSAVLTDVLPAGTTFIPGSLECKLGTCWYDDVDNAVYWMGEVVPSKALGTRPTPGLLITQESRRSDPRREKEEANGLEQLPQTILPSTAPPGVVLETLTNTWDVMATGLVYNPSGDEVRYSHEEFETADIWDIDYPVPHNVLGSILLSAVNPGWPETLDMRNGIGYDSTTGTYFLPDYNGDVTNANDNVVEISAAGTILNAWETFGASNDSYDGSSIRHIKDIAVVPGTTNRYFVTALRDGSVVYEIDLIRTGTWWQPASWGTVYTCTVPGLVDNAGIDYDADHGLLYHSDNNSTNIVVTDLACNPVNAFTCDSPAGWNSGVTYVEGKSESEIWVTDWESDSTTRCSRSLLPPCEPVTLFFDDLEAGLGNWATTGLWHQEQEADACGALVVPFPSPDTAAYFGLDSTCTYNTGAAVAGTLEMILDVDLTAATNANLNFWSYEETECNGFCDQDRRYVDVSTDGGATWATVWTSIGPEGEWYQATTNLWRYLGGPLRLRFRFDGDAVQNDYFGWMVDNIEIAACLPAAVHFSVDSLGWCGEVVNEAVIASSAATSVTVTATTSVVDELYYFWDFEPDNGGFVADPAGQWQWGMPDYPADLTAHSGTKVWGTNLHGNADDTVGHHRLVKSVALPNKPEGLFLDWWDWNGAEADDCINVLVDGAQVYQQCDLDQRYWAQHAVDVSAWAGQTVDIEFDLEVCCTNPGPNGWYIDDVAIYGDCISSYLYLPIIAKEA
jgi:uncharacterized repeat protein (TIGR01451 family)